MDSFNSQLDLDSAQFSSKNKNVNEFPLRGFTAKNYFYFLIAHIVSSLLAIILYSLYTKGDTIVEAWIYISVHIIIMGSIVVEGALLSTDNYFRAPSILRHDLFIFIINLSGCAVLFSAFLVNMTGSTKPGLVTASLFSMVNYTLCALVAALIVGKYIK